MKYSSISLILILLLFVAINTYAFEPLFHARIDYGAGSFPSSVFAVDLDGDGDNDLAVANSYSGNVSILINLSNATGLDDSPETSLPESFSISQNYPNPFNASTTIKYELPHLAHVTIDIYNILGRKVEMLVDNQQPAGYHQVTWHADGFTSGIYFYKLQADEYAKTKKMVLVK